MYDFHWHTYLPKNWTSFKDGALAVGHTIHLSASLKVFLVNDSNLSNNQWSFSQRSRLLHNSSNFNNGQGHTFLFIQLNQRKMNCKKRVGFFCYSYSLYSRCLWQRQMWMSLPRLLCAKMRNDVCTAMLLWTLRTSEFFS